MLRVIGTVLAFVFVTACADAPLTQSATQGLQSGQNTPQRQNVRDELPTPNQSFAAFRSVVGSMEPTLERECRRRTKDVDCDFDIRIDPNPRAPLNAYQTLDAKKRPIIVFTQALINDARNRDELAFVLGHEAAHHIHGHIAKSQSNAAAGAILLGGLAAVLGGDASAVDAALRTGASVGGRSYSKEFELEADSLGAILTHVSGYDPLRGAGFFNRIPDPGNRFLGTHPPNAQRIEIVRQTVAKL